MRMLRFKHFSFKLNIAFGRNAERKQEEENSLRERRLGWGDVERVVVYVCVMQLSA